jgi:hypothetical protein
MLVYTRVHPYVITLIVELVALYLGNIRTEAAVPFGAIISITALSHLFSSDPLRTIKTQWMALFLTLCSSLVAAGFGSVFMACLLQLIVDWLYTSNTLYYHKTVIRLVIGIIVQATYAKKSASTYTSAILLVSVLHATYVYFKYRKKKTVKKS